MANLDFENLKHFQNPGHLLLTAPSIIAAGTKLLALCIGITFISDCLVIFKSTLFSPSDEFNTPLHSKTCDFSLWKHWFQPYLEPDISTCSIPLFLILHGMQLFLRAFLGSF